MHTGLSYYTPWGLMFIVVVLVIMVMVLVVYDIVWYTGPDNNGDGVGGPEVVILLVLVLEVPRMISSWC